MSRSAVRSTLEVIGILLGAIIAAWVIQAYLIKPFQIPSESMVPTINPGDRILINRLAYRYGDIKRGDIIVFKAPFDPETDFVKRVVAVAGDTVEVKRGGLIVNGEPQIEDFVNPESIDLSTFPMQTVPEGNVFVMGDNRTNSQDGRYWKPPWLPVENVIGKAFFTYWPPSRTGMLE
jgi:signal peptidase I